MFGETNTFDVEIQIVVGIVSIITLGLIPILMRRNTNQHKSGENGRTEQTVLLNLLLDNQGLIKTTVCEIKEDVGEVKKVNTELVKEVEKHAGEIKRIGHILNKD